MGCFLGTDLNPARDNLWFTLLFKHRGILSTDDREFRDLLGAFFLAMTGRGPLRRRHIRLVHKLADQDRGQHQRDWLRLRAERLLAADHALDPNTPWGWKEPNTHVVIDRIHLLCPRLKYVHVARHGLDMAFSRNQNQLALWGETFLGGPPEPSPRTALKFWHAVHRRILDVGHDMGDRFLFLNFDRFCRQPDDGIEQLSQFLGCDLHPSQRDALRSQVTVPDSMGRFRAHSLYPFDPEDVDFVRSLGFDIGSSTREFRKS